MAEPTHKQRDAHRQMQEQRAHVARLRSSGQLPAPGGVDAAAIAATADAARAGNLRIRDIKGGAADNVLHIPAGRPLREAINFLAENKIGLALVVDADGSLAGVLSERDVIRAISEHGSDALKLPTSAFMAADVFTCSSDDLVADIAGIMATRHFRHVPIVDDGYLMGMLSASDLVRHVGSKNAG